MMTMLEDPIFVFMWLGFLMLMSVGTALFFIWAVRSQQFSQQDRARYLPLQSGIPVEVGSGPEYGKLLQTDPVPPAPCAEQLGAQAGEAPRSAGEGAPRATGSHEIPGLSGEGS
jgi:nitrogen fixation-related uncharacterized protein